VTIRPTWTLAVVTSLLAGCGGSEPGEQRPAPNPLLHPEQFAEISPATFQVLFETSVGDFVVEVHREWAPLGADRFYNLVTAGYYDDTRIYRVVEGFMAQFGLNPNPYVNQAWKTQFIIDDPVTRTNSRGTIRSPKLSREWWWRMPSTPSTVMAHREGMDRMQQWLRRAVMSTSIPIFLNSQESSEQQLASRVHRTVMLP